MKRKQAPTEEESGAKHTKSGGSNVTGNWTMTTAHARALLRSGEVVCFGMSDCKLQPGVAGIIASCPTLQEVSAVRYKAPRDIASFGRSPALKSILVCATPVQDDTLASLARSTSLTEVNLSRSRMSCFAVAIIAACPTLRRFDVSYTTTGDGGLPALARNAALTDLNLQETMVTDVGVSELALCPSLASLSLRSCPRVTNASVVALAASPALTELHVCDTAVTGHVLESLAASKTLTTFCLEGSDLAMDRIPALRRTCIEQLICQLRITGDVALEVRRTCHDNKKKNKIRRIASALVALPELSFVPVVLLQIVAEYAVE